jgi:uncharacterized protein (DUF2062 family)
MVLMKRLRIYYDRFISLKGEPASIAAGFAIGVFVGVTPTIPFHTAMIVFLRLCFGRISPPPTLGHGSYRIR